MMKRIVKQCFLILLALIVTVPVLAQDNAKPYAVIGNQPINARSCPHVNCPVVQSIQPGETVMVVDTEEGDDVLGSNQWYKVDVDGKTMYVHSSLVQASSVNDAGTPSVVKKIDTSDWTKYKGKGYSFLAPSDWVDKFALMEDKDYQEAVAEMEGVKPDDIKMGWEAAKAAGLVAFLTSENYVMLEVKKMPIKDTTIKVTYQMLKPALKASFAEGGAKVSSIDLIRLPLGDCLHIHAKQLRDTATMYKGEQIVQYFTFTVDYIYTISIYTPESELTKVDPIFDAIAQSLTFIRGGANA